MRDVEYCGKQEDVHVFGGAAAALRRIKEKGYKIIVVTNQSGIGRGYFTEPEYREVEREVARQLGPDLIDATYFCPDLPESGSSRRKPAPGMIFEAAEAHQLDLSRSFFVGDKAIDAQCGRNAGVRTIIVQTGLQPDLNAGGDWTARDLLEAADIILHHGL